MEADWEVVLAADDPVVVVPWQAPDGGCRFVDLRQNPELIVAVKEAQHNPALRDVLLALNAAHSPLWTAKCDVWVSDEACDPYEMDAEPQETAFVAGSYIDLLHREGPFSKSFHEPLNHSFALQERWLRASTDQLRALRCGASRVDLVLRRAEVFGQAAFAVSWFVAGCGANPETAKVSWSTALLASLKAILEPLRTAAGGRYNEGTGE